MSADIFSFWTQAAEAGVLERPGRKIHPADEEVFAARGTGLFDLANHPEPFYGPLQTAPVVLLALNHNGSDAGFIDDPRMIAAHKRAWAGNEPLWRASDFQPEIKSADWMASQAKQFGITDWDVVRANFAILNLCAYRSPRFEDYWSLTELPSSQVALAFAKDVLLPEARAKQRVVICIYAAKYWGLPIGEPDGFLFAPDIPWSWIRLVDRPPIVAAIAERMSAAQAG